MVPNVQYYGRVDSVGGRISSTLQEICLYKHMPKEWAQRTSSIRHPEGQGAEPEWTGEQGRGNVSREQEQSQRGEDERVCAVNNGHAA